MDGFRANRELTTILLNPVAKLREGLREQVEMKRIIITIFALAALAAIAYSQTEQKTPSFRPKEGFVPNAETAVKVGEAVLMPVYGEKRIVGERPFKAALQGDVWTVEGTLHCGGPPGTTCHWCLRREAVAPDIAKDSDQIKQD
jgi:hypothetical protein